MCNCGSDNMSISVGRFCQYKIQKAPSSTIQQPPNAVSQWTQPFTFDVTTQGEDIMPTAQAQINNLCYIVYSVGGAVVDPNIPCWRLATNSHQVETYQVTVVPYVTTQLPTSGASTVIIQVRYNHEYHDLYEVQVYTLGPNSPNWGSCYIDGTAHYNPHDGTCFCKAGYHGDTCKVSTTLGNVGFSSVAFGQNVLIKVQWHGDTNSPGLQEWGSVVSNLKLIVNGAEFFTEPLVNYGFYTEINFTPSSEIHMWSALQLTLGSKTTPIINTDGIAGVYHKPIAINPQCAFSSAIVSDGTCRCEGIVNNNRYFGKYCQYKLEYGLDGPQNQWEVPPTYPMQRTFLLRMVWDAAYPNDHTNPVDGTSRVEFMLWYYDDNPSTPNTISAIQPTTRAVVKNIMLPPDNADQSAVYPNYIALLFPLTLEQSNPASQIGIVLANNTQDTFYTGTADADVIMIKSANGAFPASHYHCGHTYDELWHNYNEGVHTTINFDKLLLLEHIHGAPQHHTMNPGDPYPKRVRGHCMPCAVGKFGPHCEYGFTPLRTNYDDVFVAWDAYNSVHQGFHIYYNMEHPPQDVITAGWSRNAHCEIVLQAKENGAERVVSDCAIRSPADPRTNRFRVVIIPYDVSSGMYTLLARVNGIEVGLIGNVRVEERPQEDIDNGPCPAPNHRYSSYWHDASGGCFDVPRPENATRYLKPVCFDVFGYPMDTTNALCGPGYSQFPIALTTSCLHRPDVPPPDPILPTNVTLSTIIITNGQGEDVDIISNPNIIHTAARGTITWRVQGNADVGTVSVFLVGAYRLSQQITTTTTSYNILLTTTPLAALTAQFTIPTNIHTADDNSLTARIMLQYNQNLSLQSYSPQLSLHNAPNLCQINAVTCPTNTNTQCAPLTGLCTECLPFHKPDPTTPGRCVLLCDDLCQNGGTCVPTTIPIFDAQTNTTILTAPPQCECPSGFLQPFCIQKQSCAERSLEQCGPHGDLLPLQGANAGDNECATTCTCHTNWSIPTNPSTTKCTECNLGCDVLGTNFTLTNMSCQQCICQHGFTGPTCSLRSFYGTIEFSGVPQQPTPTPPGTFQIATMQQQQQQQPQAIKTKNIITTTPTKRQLYLQSLFSTPTVAQVQAALEMKAIMPMSANSNTTTQTFLSNEALEVLERDLALSLDVDEGNVKFLRLTRNRDNSTLQSAMTLTSDDGDDDDQQQQDESITALFEIISTTSALTTTATDGNQNAAQFTILQTPTSTADDTTPISSLYEQWLALQGTTSTTPTKPIQQTQASNELGSMNKVNSGYDPNCKNTTSTTTTCPSGQDPFATTGGGLFPDKPPKKSSGSVGIIVGVIVGVLVVVIILFIAVICGVRHCRKNQQCCFAPVKKSKDHDQSHLELMDGDSVASSPRATSRALTSKSGVELSATNGSKKTKTKSAKESVITELSLVEDEESQELPQGWQKMKHITTGEVFYVNDSEMLSQRHKPGTAECADMGW